MDQEMGLNVTIRGDADSLVNAANAGSSSLKGLEGVSEEALSKLSSAISKLDVDFNRWTETSKRTEQQVKHTAETAKSEGAQIEGFTDKLLQHNYAVARGLEAVGLSSEASAARVGGALEAVKASMSGLNPVLLGLTVGLGGMFAAFELLKTSADEASKWDQNMQILGQTVRNQRGDWDKLRDTVQEWADLQEKTTIFSRDEAVQALRLLTAAGTDLSDSMKIVRVAEDAAAATGHSLTDVVHGLMEAEHGRTQVLAELGIGTRASIKDGMSLRDILNEIEKHMGGAASAAADTYAGKLQQLSNAISALKEDIGVKLLPYLTRFVDELKNWADAVDQNLPKIEAEFGKVYNAVKSVTDFLEKHKDQVAFFFGTVLAVQAVKALAAVRAGFIAMRASMVTSETWVAITSAVQQAALIFGLEGGGLAGGLRAATVAFNGLRIAEAAATLGLAAFIGWLVDGHFGDAVNFATNAIGSLIRSFGELASAIGQFTHNDGLIALGTSIMSMADAGTSKTPVGTSKPFDWGSMWGHSGGNSADTNVSVNPQVGGLLGGGKSHKSTTPTFKGEGIYYYYEGLQLTTKEQQKFTNELYATGEALGKEILALDKSREANEAKNHDERATYGMTTQQEIAYYQNRLANLDKFDADYLQKKTALENKIDDLQTQEYKQQYDKAKQAHDQQVQLIKDWADKGVTLFNDFFTHGKNGFKDFADAFKKMLDDMLVALEKSALTKLLAKIFNVDLSPDWSPNMGGAPVSSGGGSPSGILSFLGLGSAASPYSASSTAADMASAGTLSSIGSGAVGAPSSGGGGFLSGLGGGIPFGKNIGGASVGSYLAAAAGGAMIGQTVFGGKGYADVGGAMGAAAALALAGPAGWAAIAAMTIGGALIGGGAGSLFGNHFDPANEPDIYQQDAWGQENADMTGGEWTANGKQYNPDSWTNQLTHNRGWNIVMENFVSKFRGKTGQLPQSLQSVFSSIEALWGGASGQADFNHDGKDGYLDIGSGKRAKWSEFWQYVQSYGPQIAQLMDNYQPADMYTSNSGSATMSGTYTPSGSPYILHDFPDYGGGGVTVPVSGGGGGTGPVSHPGPGNGPIVPPGAGSSPIASPAPVGNPISGGGSNKPQVIVQQYISGNVLTESDLYHSANKAIAQHSATGAALRMNMVGK